MNSKKRYWLRGGLTLSIIAEILYLLVAGIPIMKYSEGFGPVAVIIYSLGIIIVFFFIGAIIGWIWGKFPERG